MNEPSVPDAVWPPETAALSRFGWPPSPSPDQGCAPNPFDNLCQIDWDMDGYGTPPAPHDLNHDQDTLDEVKDSNDWARMMDRSTSGLSTTRESRFPVYGSNFQQLPPQDYTAWHMPATVAGGVTLVNGPPAFSWYLSFPGPCSGQGCTPPSVTVAANNVTKTMGAVVDSDVMAAPQGFRVDVNFKVDAWPTIGGHQLVFSNLFEIDVPATGTEQRRVRAWVHDGQSKQALVNQATEIVVGQWYWVRVTWEKYGSPEALKRFKVVVVPFDATNNNWKIDFATCTSADIPLVGAVDPGSIVFGTFPPGSSYWTLQGGLDDPWLVNSPGLGRRWLDAGDIFDAVTCAGAGGTTND